MPVTKVAQKLLRLVLYVTQADLVVKEKEKEDSVVGHDGVRSVLEGEEG